MTFYTLAMKVAYAIRRAINYFKMGILFAKTEHLLKRNKKLSVQILKLEAYKAKRGWK